MEWDGPGYSCDEEMAELATAVFGLVEAFKALDWSRLDDVDQESDEYDEVEPLIQLRQASTAALKALSYALSEAIQT